MLSSAEPNHNPPQSDCNAATSFAQSNNEKEALTPDSSENKPQTPASTPTTLQGEALMAHILQYLQTLVFPHLVQRPEPYLKNIELKRLGVQVTGFSLASGDAQPPARFAGPFLRPVEASCVSSWLGSRGVNRDWLPLCGRGSMRESNYSEALDILRFFDLLLTENVQSTTKPGYSTAPPVLTCTPWRWHFTGMKNLSRKYPFIDFKRLWSVARVYRPTLDEVGGWSVEGHNWDPRRPHIFVTLAEDHNIQSNMAFTSEVQTILLLACRYATQKPLGQHELIPVTVLTCSWRTCRIVQGIVNLRTRQVELRISKNVDLEGGALKNWDNLLSLLGWIIAEPVGETM